MSKNKYAVIAKNISKCYKMYSGPKEKLLDLVLPKGRGKEFKALKNISFEIERGEIVGLLGLNGAGKSTLSNILGGVSLPSEGTIEINGESAVIAIGLGLNNFLTGIENIEVKATMMGYKKEEITRITKEVIEFAEIGDFINQPIRTYSSGMRSRLGFGIAVNMSPDILVIDEALSVGDPTFAQKCLDKMNEFKNSGKTIFFVSHSLPQVKEFCTKAMWLEYGALKEYGDIKEVLPKYEGYIKKINAMSEKEKKEYKAKVLKEQEHGLLEEFNYKSFNPKSLELQGKFIKSTILTNGIDEKKINYNFDVLTALLGFLPSLYRDKKSDAIIIAIIQFLNFFIMSMPAAIITNFIFTAIIAGFTGKRYVKDLILNKEFKSIKHEKVEVEKEQISGEKTLLRSMKNKLEIRKKINKKMYISAAIAVSFMIGSGYIINDINLKNKKATLNLKSIGYLILEKNDKGETVIDSIAVAKKNDKKVVSLKVYPGDLLIDYNGENILSNIVNYKDIIGMRKIMKDNFKEEIGDYVVIDSDDYIENSLDYYFSMVEKNNISKNDGTIKVTDSSMSSRNFDSIEKFYKDSTRINIAAIKYKEKTIEEVFKENKITIPNELSNKDYKIKYLDEKMLKSEKFINSLKEMK